MALPQSAYKDREFLAVIGDEVLTTPALEATPSSLQRPTYTNSTQDSVTGILLAGVGHVTDPPDSQKNYLVVDSKTETHTIESAFESFTRERKDIAIVLINQHIADRIRGKVDAYNEAFPSLLEIPSKDHPYDAERDSVMKRVRKLFGE
jgi:V-type H+-transporting ATPase subunit F